MNKVLRRILTVFGSLIIIFILVLTSLEFSNISKTEEEVFEIYEYQLGSILFSVNQYSQDVLSGWVQEINDQLLLPDSERDLQESFFPNHPSVNIIFLADSTYKQVRIISPNSGVSFTVVEDILNENDDLVKRLFTFLDTDYQKLEPVSDPQGRSYLLFALRGSGAKQIAGMEISSSSFIQEVLAPRLQTVARDEIILSAISAVQDSVVFTTDAINLDVENMVKTTESTLWLFPSYYLGISTMGRTLQDVVSQRTRTNLILLTMISLILVSGVWLIVININKEVALAKMKADFVSNVSHEIRTPLALISMFAETLEMGRVRDDKERNRFYKIISSEASRLSRLVNRILSFSKMEAGKKSYKFAPVDTNMIVDEIMDSYSYHLESKGFTAECTKENVPEIMADREAMSEAIINLIDNAIKYSKEDKRIFVKTGEEKEYVFVEVADHGIGIAPDQQKRIFEKFYRAEDALVHDTKGSGLGLNLLKEIVESHNGYIEMKSKQGKGTSFKLFFPKNNVEI